MRKSFSCFLVLSVLLPAAQAETHIGQTAKDLGGSVLLVNHEEATRFCLNRGSRLPTIHEYAQLSASLGSMGSRETQYLDIPINDVIVEEEITRNGAEGFSPLFRLNSAARFVIDFYFNSTGYNAPSAAPEDVSRFWSSTTNPRQPDKRYAFDGKTGFVSVSYSVRYNKFAVRCMEGRP